MSYNGIGLSSVRGSATSGHVQANRGHVNANSLRRQQERNSQSNSRPKFNPVSSAARQQGHAEIQKHEERRRIENELLELQEEMQDAGKLSPEEINERIGRERTRLMNRLEGKHEQGNHRLHQGQPQSRGHRWDRQKTAANQILKTQQSDRLGSALGIQRDVHVEGQAFDIDFQQQKKAARLARSEQEKKQMEEQAKRSRKEAKAKAKEAKNHGGRNRRSEASESSRSDSSSDESSGSSSSHSSSASSREHKRRRRSDSPSSIKSS